MKHIKEYKIFESGLKSSELRPLSDLIKSKIGVKEFLLNGEPHRFAIMVSGSIPKSIYGKKVIDVSFACDYSSMSWNDLDESLRGGDLVQHILNVISDYEMKPVVLWGWNYFGSQEMLSKENFSSTDMLISRVYDLVSKLNSRISYLNDNGDIICNSYVPIHLWFLVMD